VEGTAMRVYSNPATHRLEKEARKLGYECEIRIMEPSEEGHYFVTKADGETLKTPVSLGWTDQHAIESLKRHVWSHGLEGAF
jgi:hypothetical protein